MSQSPAGMESSAASERYFANWSKLGSMVSRGASFSGRERNRCFLNTRGPRFADVSTIAGLDQIDDGRGIAVVDWDHDGDLDLWLSNRTGPRVRMLRNEMPESSHFVAFQLQGTTCNRDAIGARVELVLAASASPSSPRKRIKSLRAGEGFLSQSSKWIHFGLGDEKETAQVRIFWPGQRTPQVFAGIDVNQRYRLVQGEPAARLVPTQPRGRDWIARPSSEAATTDRARTILTRRMRVPEIECRDLETGKQKNETPRGPLLINIWASWCAPCVAELNQLTRHANQLREKGLRILALSTDAVDPSTGVRANSDLETIRRLGFPFDAAAVDESQLRKLTDLTHRIFYPQKPLSLPCSFLVDSHGNLAAFYRGPVSVEQLLADLDLLSADRAQIAQAAFPFPGRRLLRTHEPSPLSIAKAYLEGGYLDQARQQVLAHLHEVSEVRDFDRLAEMLNDSFRPGVSRRQAAANAAATKADEALVSALQAEQRRRQALGLRLLADIEHRRKSPEGVEQALRKLLQLDPSNHTARGELAVVLAGQNKMDEAEREFAQLKSDGREQVKAQLALGQSLMQIGRADQAQRCFEEAVRMVDDNVEARFNLAMARQISNDPRQAMEQYRWILQRDPDHHETLNNLAWLYATSRDEKRDPQEAVRLARQLCRSTQFRSPAYLDTLATALAEAGDFEAAVDVASTAYRLARGRGESRIANRLKPRIALYRSGQRLSDQTE